MRFAKPITFRLREVSARGKVICGQSTCVVAIIRECDLDRLTVLFTDPRWKNFHEAQTKAKIDGICDRTE